MLPDDLKRKYQSVPDFTLVEIEDIHTKTPMGDEMVHCAAVLGDVVDIEMLVGLGADVNEAGEDGYTPLHYAVQQGHFNAVRFLLAHGADADQLNAYGVSSREMANDQGMDFSSL